MVGNNNNNNQQGSDPYNFGVLLQDTAADGQSRPRRDGQGQPTHDEKTALNGRSTPRNDEADSRDGRPASSSTQDSCRNENQQEDNHEHVDVPVPENAGPNAALFLTTLNQTNRLLQQQS